MNHTMTLALKPQMFPQDGSEDYKHAYITNKQQGNAAFKQKHHAIHNLPGVTTQWPKLHAIANKDKHASMRAGQPSTPQAEPRGHAPQTRCRVPPTVQYADTKY